MYHRGAPTGCTLDQEPAHGPRTKDIAKPFPWDILLVKGWFFWRQNPKNFRQNCDSQLQNFPASPPAATRLFDSFRMRIDSRLSLGFYGNPWHCWSKGISSFAQGCTRPCCATFCQRELQTRYVEIFSLKVECNHFFRVAIRSFTQTERPVAKWHVSTTVIKRANLPSWTSGLEELQCVLWQLARCCNDLKSQRFQSAPHGAMCHPLVLQSRPNTSNQVLQRHQLNPSWIQIREPGDRAYHEKKWKQKETLNGNRTMLSHSTHLSAALTTIWLTCTDLSGFLSKIWRRRP